MTEQQAPQTEEARMNKAQLLALSVQNITTGQLADVFIRSGYFPDARSLSQAAVKIIAGHELGFGPMASMNGIYIIEGKVSLSANLMAACIKRSGRYTYRIKTMNDDLCELEFFEVSTDKAGKRLLDTIGASTFSRADAIRAKTKNMDKFPRNMLFSRAMSNGFRWHTPDLSGGAIYTPEELGADTNEEGEVVGHTPVASGQQVIEQPKAMPNSLGTVGEMARQAADGLPTQAQAEAQLKAEVPNYKTEAEKAAPAKPAAKVIEQPPVIDDEEMQEPELGHEMDPLPKAQASEPAIYVKGLLTYRMEGDVEMVQVGTGWRVANEPVGMKGLSQAQKEKINGMFADAKGTNQTKHMVAHFEKYFSKKTIPALTWEEVLVLTLAHKDPMQLDPRYYQEKIDELAAKTAKAEAKAEKTEPVKVPANTAAKLSKAFSLDKTDELIAELAVLEKPDLDKLATLYTVHNWTATNRDDLAFLLTLIGGKQLDIHNPVSWQEMVDGIPANPEPKE